jgi:branched-chain amino acid transport system permease protein
VGYVALGECHDGCEGRNASMSWVLQLFNGLAMASLLFLLASGLTLAFGLMRIVNLAHGAFYLLGGYIGVSVLGRFTNFWLAVLLGGLGVAALAFVAERTIFRKVGEHVLRQVLMTLGLAYVIGDLTLAYWGGGVRSVRPPEWISGSTRIFDWFAYPTYRLFLVVAGVVMAVVLWLMQRRTAVGMAIRAGVDDREMAAALGVNVQSLFTVVFVFAAFIAGVSGVLGGGFLRIYPGADWEVLVLALVVIIIGGLGSLKGAMIGALLVGVVDTYGRWLFPEFAFAMVFAPMAVLLAIRPQGLFGKEVA